MPTIAVHQPNRSTRFLLESTNPPAFQFRSVPELQILLHTRKLDGVVLGLGLDAIEVVVEITDRPLLGAGEPVIAAVHPEPLALRQALALLQTDMAIRLSLLTMGRIALIAEVHRLETTGDLARDNLLKRVAPLIPLKLAHLLLPALVIGGQRASAGDLAEAAGLPERTLRQHLRQHDLPSPLKLLGIVAGTHQALYAEECLLSSAGAALRAGFTSSEEVRRYLKHRTGRSTAEWRGLGWGRSVQELRDLW